mgnify:CR=1 FL=1
MNFLRKYITRNFVLVTLFATFLQIVTLSASRSNYQIQSENLSETCFTESNHFIHSPCNLENSLKKFERASQKESTDFKTFRSTDFFYSDETVRKIQLKLAYSFNIIDELKLNQLTLNHLDLRSPPQFI